MSTAPALKPSRVFVGAATRKGTKEDGSRDKKEKGMEEKREANEVTAA